MKLSEKTADRLYEMIVEEQCYRPGNKLPNENELSEALQVSRTTLREAITFLVAQGVLEIRRGKGTFVAEELPVSGLDLTSLAGLRSRVRAKDLFEMRLIFEPEAAYYAALRATDKEIERIVSLGAEIEERIRQEKDRTEVEQAFHKSIAKATHNEFMNQLMPVIYEGINKGVRLSKVHEEAVQATLVDHKMLMDFLKVRNAEGARNAMRIHILHAMEQLPME